MNDFLLQTGGTLLALAAVLALAWATLRLLRGRIGGARAAGGADDDALRFVRALPLGTRERVVLMEHRGERWMLGVSAGGISVLGRWPAAAKEKPPSD